MNDLMSGGLHRAWKDVMVAVLNPPRTTGLRVISTSPAAPATSPSASSRRGGAATRGHRLDINADMLAVGRDAR